MATAHHSSTSPEGLHLVGRLVEASNATFLVEDSGGKKFVYKPVAGEAPLWDFPTGTLGRREVAAYELSRASGFDVVPSTTWIEGPLGEGSLQVWVEDSGPELARLVPVDEVPGDWYGIVLGVDAHDREVALIHADHPGLRRLALFDVLVNNADRKAGHILRAGDAVFGCDHGVSFHVDHKLRTILWGWAGDPLTDAEIALLRSVPGVSQVLEDWLDPPEMDALLTRCEALLQAGIFPAPGDAWPVIPWPPI
ncbi:MAG TPA: SCO1664 family protein [Propionibacteriaceae bacterium]|nr:SCO1664 family protein [Propionibacteriaceae bacterium]